MTTLNPLHTTSHLARLLESTTLETGLLGNLTLKAGSGSDKIFVSKGPDGLYHVNVNGKDHAFTKEQMSRLTIDAGAGNDRVFVHPSVDVGVKVQGGAGHDTIMNFANRSSIDAGAGHDRVFNRSHGSSIQGGCGNDAIDSFGSGNVVRGGFGHDRVSSAGNRNYVHGGFGNDTVTSRGFGNSVHGGFGADFVASAGFGNKVTGGFGPDFVANHTPFEIRSFLDQLQGLVGSNPPAYCPSGDPCRPFAGPCRPVEGYGCTAQSVDLARPASSGFGKIVEEYRAKQLESEIMSNPMLRSLVGQLLGGTIATDGAIDGRLTVMRPNKADVSGIVAKMLPFAGEVGGLLGQLGGVAQALGGVNPLAGLMLQALGGLGGDLGSLGGAGSGSLNPNARPGLINNTTAAAEKQHQSEVDSVLNDPSLTVEDRVMLMLMLVMKKMDKDIESQNQYLNKIQQQQADKDGKGGGVGEVLSNIPMVGSLLGGLFGGGSGGQEGAPSIDLESQKLSRMVNKRSQMFDTLKGIMDKYNETAKGVIQSMGR